MTNLSILKIESKLGTLLLSRNAMQKITSVNKRRIYRNIDGDLLQNNEPTKLKCVIETRDTPDMAILKLNDLFTVYSIVEFRQNNFEDPHINYVKDSYKRYDDYAIFRPILAGFLTDFSCESNNLSEATWRLEFEGI